MDAEWVIYSYRFRKKFNSIPVQPSLLHLSSSLKHAGLPREHKSYDKTQHNYESPNIYKCVYDTDWHCRDSL